MVLHSSSQHFLGLMDIRFWNSCCLWLLWRLLRWQRTYFFESSFKSRTSSRLVGRLLLGNRLSHLWCLVCLLPLKCFSLWAVLYLRCFQLLGLRSLKFIFLFRIASFLMISFPHEPCHLSNMISQFLLRRVMKAWTILMAWKIFLLQFACDP